MIIVLLVEDAGSRFDSFDPAEREKLCEKYLRATRDGNSEFVILLKGPPDLLVSFVEKDE